MLLILWLVEPTIQEREKFFIPSMDVSNFPQATHQSVSTNDKVESLSHCSHDKVENSLSHCNCHLLNVATGITRFCFLVFSAIFTRQQYLISHVQVTRPLLEQIRRCLMLELTDASALYFFAFCYENVSYLLNY